MSSPKVRTACILLLCALTPTALLTACLALVGIYPFGTISALSQDFDIAYQYANILAWLQGVFTGEGSLLYSFGKSLGGNMFPTFTYYAASPLNLLLPLFGKDDIDTFVFVTRLLRTALCGFTLGLYCLRRFELTGAWCIVFSCCYALGQAMLIQSTNIMWLDAMWLLPLIALGVFSHVREGKSLLFIVSLSVCIVSCWYTGYMAVLASLVLFCTEYALQDFKDAPFDAKALLRRLVRFGLILLFVAAATAVVLLPSVIGLLAGKAGESSAAASLVRYRPEHFLPAFFTLNFVVGWKAPQFFCGTIATLAIVLLLISRQIERKTKIVCLVVLGALIVSTEFSLLERIWTGFKDGGNYFCRWGFILEFFMLFFAMNLVQRWRFDARELGIAGALIALLGAGALLCGGFDPLSGTDALFAPAVCFVLFLAILALYALSMAVQRQEGWTGRFIALLLVACFLDMGLNAYASCKADAHKGAWTQESYLEYQEESLGSIERLQTGSNAPAPYRMEKLGSYLQPYARGAVPTSEGLALGYLPLSSYLSTNDAAVTQEMGELGYSPLHHPGNFAVFHNLYPDALPGSDSLLSLRYVAAPSTPADYADTGISSGKEGWSWYENENAFPLAFAVGESAVKDVTFDGSSLDYQNVLFKALFPDSAPLYALARTNVESRTEEGVVWSVEADDDGKLGFIQVSTEAAYPQYFYPGYGLTVNGVSLDGGYGRAWSDGLVPVSSLSDAHIGVWRPEFQHDESLTLHAGTLNEDALRACRTQAWENAGTFETFQDGLVKMTCTSDGSEQAYLFTTIPYDEGWTITVNGTAADAAQAAGTFTAIPLEQGENLIEMSYCPPGLVVGGAASLVAWLGLFAFLLVRKRLSHDV